MPVTETETSRAERWLYQTLVNDVTLASLTAGRIYADYAPLGATFPVIIFQQQLAYQDLVGSGMGRIWADLLYIVKATGQTEDLGSLAPIAAQIDTLLQKAASPTDGPGSISNCRRQRPFRLAEIDPGGVHYLHLGGYYRLRVHPG